MLRQAFAGLIWSQQYYEYPVERWLEGDPGREPPPGARLSGRNSDWTGLSAAGVMVMPHGWEYPRFAFRDLAVHALALQPFDPELARSQLTLLLQPRYLREDGQLPAHEWSFSEPMTLLCKRVRGTPTAHHDVVQRKQEPAPEPREH